MKYVINLCFGGFGLSDKAFEWLEKHKGWKKGVTYEDDCDFYLSESGFGGKYYMKRNDYELDFRCNPDLVECVETLGDAANNMCAELGVVECPYGPDDGIEIHEYDGSENLQTIPERW